ncbi:MAG: amidase, partial [Mesorhizobium sp.]|nr:amidase [Mesorhizobium sp.]
MQSVVAILDAIAEGRSTPRDAVAASLDAIAAHDRGIGAFEAIADRDAVLDAAGRATGPLAGIAVGIKDIFDTFDLPTTYGSPLYAGHRPRADAALVAMIRAAGASVVGKTVTTEFAFLNPARTRNPRNVAHTPGGSSSGSVAAISASMIPAAIGTQTGGSIIRPASYCGVAGYKPSFRLVPTVGAKTFSWSLDTAGFFAAGVADVARFAALVTGRSLDVTPVDPAGLRVGVYRGAIWNEATPAMQDALARAADIAAQAGASVVDMDETSALAAGRDAHATIQNFEAGLAMAHEFTHHRAELSSILRKTLADGRLIGPEAYDKARAAARQARHAATALFDRVDVLLAPSAPGVAPVGLESTGSPIFNKLWTLTGNPCVNVPGLKDPFGMPLGIQLVARFGRDQLALSAA